MPAPVRISAIAEKAKVRLQEFLHAQAARGLTSDQVAALVDLPARCLSQIKHGRRTMSELVARRLAERFGVNHAWLLGTSDSVDPPAVWSALGPDPPPVWLPLFHAPIFHSEPRLHPSWERQVVALSCTAAARAMRAATPYILHFADRDDEGRLHPGDLILMSQMPCHNASVHVISYRNEILLARNEEHGGWRRLADGGKIWSGATVVGHCVGIIWSELAPIRMSLPCAIGAAPTTSALRPN